MKYQKTSNKQAEVNFRVKIAAQQCKSVVSFENERTFPQMFAELKRRTERTFDDFKRLKHKKINFSPFLEIGSEYCERPMVLEKKFGAIGFASDISLFSLQTAKDFCKPLGFSKTPPRIVLDANQLPFADNSLPFVFCYQTLHHFPDPKPVLMEIHRVLSPGGYFFFDEEPVKQSLNLDLWRRPTNLRPWEKALKYIGILPFISRIGKTEVDYGILEEVFGLDTWEKALDVFEQVEAKSKPFPVGPESIKYKNGKSGWIKPSFLTHLLIFLWGGGMGAVCRKKGNAPEKPMSLTDALSCPDCKKKLKKANGKYSCGNCKVTFPTVGNVLVLLGKQNLQSLYPKLVS